MQRRRKDDEANSENAHDPLHGCSSTAGGWSAGDGAGKGNECAATATSTAPDGGDAGPGHGRRPDGAASAANGARLPHGAARPVVGQSGDRAEGWLECGA